MNDADCIRMASLITSRIFSMLAMELKKHRFSTEREVYDWLILKTDEAGCELAFNPIVAAKGNHNDIHHKPTDTKLSNGFLIVDFAVKYKGLCSDMTRTFYIGKPSKEDIELYNLVLLAQETSLMHAVPGNYCADVDLIARTILLKYFSHFRHSLGHGVGRRIHQKPTLKPRSRYILKEGEVITIEPGLYFNDRGIRIEDTIIVKENPEVLTRFTKKLICI